MQIPLNASKWYDKIWAAFIFFTRLPIWRMHQPPRESYRAVLEYWPLTGWFTGIIMAVVLLGGCMILPNSIAVLLAIVVRMLLTGALHEDGLCDFFDGMGGGMSRERILAIMKDSRIGTYGMLGMLFYTLLLFNTLRTMPVQISALAILMADPYAKMLSAQVVQMMPYARTEEESKAKTVYRKMDIKASILLFIQGFLPMAVGLLLLRGTVNWQIIVFCPCIAMYLLYLLIWRKLRGYTGDCCGALFLLIELSTYLCIASQVHNNIALLNLLGKLSY